MANTTPDQNETAPEQAQEPAHKPRRTDVNWMKPHQLTVEEGLNLRYDYGDIEALAKSIVENGVKMPLRAYKKTGEEKLTLTDGHRRFKAIQLAYSWGHTDIEIPVIKEGRIPSDEDRVVGMFVYNDGKRLSPLEEAEGYDRLLKYGWSPSRIAGRVGRSITHVTDVLRLCSISSKLKQLIIDGKVSASAVIDKLKKQSADTVQGHVEKAIEDNGGKKVTAKHLPPGPAATPRVNPNKALYESILNELNDSVIDAAENNHLQQVVSWGSILEVLKKHLNISE